MDTQTIKEYLNEFYKPSVPLDANGRIIPLKFNAYSAELERKRMGLLLAISELEDKAKLLVLEELKQAKSAIEQRGFITVNSNDILQGAMAGHQGFDTFHELQVLDRLLLSSVNKAISFFEENEENKNPVALSQMKDEGKGTNEERGDGDFLAKGDSGWYNVDEVCAKYNLPKNNIKSRQWRIDNGFPTHQKGAYTRVVFNATEVEEWLSTHMKML